VFKALISTRILVLEGFQLVFWFGSWPGPLTRCALGLASSPPKCAARAKSRTLASIFLTLGEAHRRPLSPSRILRHRCRFFGSCSLTQRAATIVPGPRCRVLPTGFGAASFSLVNFCAERGQASVGELVPPVSVFGFPLPGPSPVSCSGSRARARQSA
jgi:hypothetical protein